MSLKADHTEVIWDRDYRVPQDVAGDVCDYRRARNLVLLAIAVSSEAVIEFVQHGCHGEWSISLRDLAIRPFEPA